MASSAAARKRRWRAQRRREAPPPPRTVEDLVGALDLSWRPLGACWGLDPEMFYPARGDAEALASARAVCRTCSVREPCIDLGIAELGGRAGGVYGGLSNRQLLALRRFRRARAAIEAVTEATPSPPDRKTVRPLATAARPCFDRPQPPDTPTASAPKGPAPMDYFDSGFCVREPSWHGKENLLEEAPADWPAAREAAGLTWEPVSIPVYVQRGGTEDAPGYEPLGGFQAIARGDTGAVLAVPTSSFSLISHAQMGEIIEAVLGDRLARFDTAGSVKGGRAVWAMVRLDEPFTVPGDDTATFPYLCILNAHDGSGACKVLYCLVRVVCWNTWQAASAEGDRTGCQFVFRHSGNPGDRIAAARDALAGLRTAAEDYREMMGDLGKVRVDDAMVRTFLHEFIASPADRGEQITPRVAANIEEARSLFTALYNESPTVDAVRGTGYGLLMASTEYLDHLRGFRTRDSYVGRTVLRPEAAKQRAARLIRELAPA